MAITFGVATPSGTSAGYGRAGNGDITINLPSGWAEGQLAIILLWVDCGSATTPTDWTLVSGFPKVGLEPDNYKLYAWIRFLQTGDGNPTTTISGAGSSDCSVGAIATYNGVDTSTPVEVVGTHNCNNGSPMTAPSIDIATAYSWAIGLCGRGDNENADNQSFGGSTEGVTERFDSGSNAGNDAQVSLYDKEFASTGATGQGSADTSVSDPYTSVLIALKPAVTAKTISGAGNIASAEAFGTPRLSLKILPSGIVSGEAFGTPSVNYKIAPSGIVSGEAFGNCQINLTSYPNGVVSAEAFGNATISLKTQYITNAGGIVSAESFGSTSLSLKILPTGIESAETFGTPSLSLKLLPGGIESAEGFGTPRLELYILPSGIESGEAFGNANVSIGVQTIYPSGIPSTETFGTPLLKLFLLPTGIGSAEAFGTPSVRFVILPAGIVSGESFGTPSLKFIIFPIGINSAEAFGNPTVSGAGALEIDPIGIISGEVFGMPSVVSGTIEPSGIVSAEAFGSPLVEVAIHPSGIVSAEAFGRPYMWTPLVHRAAIMRQIYPVSVNLSKMIKKLNQ